MKRQGFWCRPAIRPRSRLRLSALLKAFRFARGLAGGPESAWSKITKSVAAQSVFAIFWKAFMPDKRNNQIDPSVAYILKGFPRLSETFIASEIYRLEQEGIRLRLIVIKPADEDGQRGDS